MPSSNVATTRPHCTRSWHRMITNRSAGIPASHAADGQSHPRTSTYATGPCRACPASIARPMRVSPYPGTPTRPATCPGESESKSTEAGLVPPSLVTPSVAPSATPSSTPGLSRRDSRRDHMLSNICSIGKGGSQPQLSTSTVAVREPSGEAVIDAYVLIQTEIGKQLAVATALTEFPGVAKAVVVTGPYDVIARVSAADVNALGGAHRDRHPERRRCGTNVDQPDRAHLNARSNPVTRIGLSNADMGLLPSSRLRGVGYAGEERPKRKGAASCRLRR